MADEIEKTPTANTSVNEPESGTFGEKADLNRLKGSLPPMGAQVAEAGGPAPMPNPNLSMPPQPGGRPTRGPAGVPGAIMGAGDAPTPAAQAQSQATPQMARVALLEQLANSQEVSNTTREWARLILEQLRG